MLLNFLFNKINANSKKAVNGKYLPKDTYIKIVDFLKEFGKENIIIVCIGTNRTDIVDCLGPFVGSLLKEDNKFNIPVFGSMVNPINGINLTNRITEIRNNYPKSKIIVIDAALSHEDKIGEIFIGKELMRPGSGVRHDCAEVGDISIKAFVAPIGVDVVKYNSDLNFISAMAYTIAKGLKEAFS
ncbi:spore protease YyaC [Clostridium felsineum]|uniref:Uncharacterized protein n=1 Tax=Clostridium felsineum TaxID=36839 RepID=A0A1S8LH05_9CLOT|nr:spore protease YyaC [Clostridium felsineum]URZ04703.1 hypothetical protein CLROS_000120 [Clostridium felsineum]URZ09676.1 hypothetical protein CROST_003690 [Clostridium felsineum]